MSHKLIDNTSLRTVTVVTEDDQIVSSEDVLIAHRYPVQLHRAISVWLMNQRGQILMQQRSQKKVTGAGWWANTVCGNVRFGESYLECALRRLKEELNINFTAVGGLRHLYSFSYQAYCNDVFGEKEIDHVFVGRYDGDVAPESKEVSAVSWVELPELLKSLRAAQFQGVATAKESLSISDQLELRQRAGGINCLLGERQVTLAPWTIMMLQDDRLVEWFKQLA